MNKKQSVAKWNIGSNATLKARLGRDVMMMASERAGNIDTCSSSDTDFRKGTVTH